MDSLSLIIAAITAGVSAALTDTARQAVKDALAHLKSLLKKKFAGRACAEKTLDSYQEEPDVWQNLLERELVQAGADQDEKIVQAAQRVLALVDPKGTQAGKYNVAIAGSKGIVVGDHARVTMRFDDRD